MKVVIVKHENCGNKYLFQVPGNHFLNAGDLVRVRNKKGEALATCLCDSFTIEEDSEQFKSIVASFGATKPLQSVIGSYTFYKYDEVEAENEEYK